MNKNYDDMLNIKRPDLLYHKRMNIKNRASQFAPFAALSGYEDLVKETARLTEKKIQLDENEMEYINNILLQIKNNIDKTPTIKVEYFQKDKYKEGGNYIKITNKVKKIDEYKKIIIFIDNTYIKIEDIYKISINI